MASLGSDLQRWLSWILSTCCRGLTCKVSERTSLKEKRFVGTCQFIKQENGSAEAGFILNRLINQILKSIIRKFHMNAVKNVKNPCTAGSEEDLTNSNPLPLQVSSGNGGCHWEPRT